MTVSVPALPEAMNISIGGIGERFAPLRITHPAAERAMLSSLQKYGQLSPLVVCRLAAGEQELLDGFKRLRAARQLGLKDLSVRSLEMSLRASKAAMLQLNRVGRAISVMEEALVVHSLCHEDGLTQVEIALLLGRHKSWVCRRLMLIERLSDQAQQSIKLGLLPASLGAELARLQRCNQEGLLATIRKQGLTWRETRQVVSALLNTPRHEHAPILRDPRLTVLAPEEDIQISPADEQGLGFQVKQLLRRLLALERNCLEVTLLFSGTELGQFETHEEQRMRNGCAKALVSLDQAQEALREAAEDTQPRP